MNFYFHYCTYGFSNCYVLGSDEGSEAVIIDPGVMDEKMLNFIEGHNYIPRGVLVTHNHINHIHGLHTLKRIYDVEIYAVNNIVQRLKTNTIRDGDVLTIGPFKIAVILVPGHSSDSVVFKIGNFLFTGDALSAGLLGSTASAYGAAIQMTTLRSKILSLPGDFQVFPGHGPPTTLEVERQFNAGIQNFSATQKNHPRFRIEI